MLKNENDTKKYGRLEKTFSVKHCNRQNDMYWMMCTNEMNEWTVGCADVRNAFKLQTSKLHRYFQVRKRRSTMLTHTVIC